MKKIILIYSIRRSGCHFCCNLIISNFLRKDCNLKDLPKNINFHNNVTSPILLSDKDLESDISIYLFENSIHLLEQTIKSIPSKLINQVQVVVNIRHPLNILSSSIKINKKSCPPFYVLNNWEKYYKLSKLTKFNNIPVISFYYDKFHDIEYIIIFLKRLGINIHNLNKVFGYNVVNKYCQGSSFYTENINKIQDTNHLQVYKQYLNHQIIKDGIKMFGKIIKSDEIWINQREF